MDTCCMNISLVYCRWKTESFLGFSISFFKTQECKAPTAVTSAKTQWNKQGPNAQFGHRTRNQSGHINATLTHCVASLQLTFPLGHVTRNEMIRSKNRKKKSSMRVNPSCQRQCCDIISLSELNRVPWVYVCLRVCAHTCANHICISRIHVCTFWIYMLAPFPVPGLFEPWERLLLSWEWKASSAD